MEIKIELSQKQVLSHQTIQLLEVLQLQTQELETYIKNLAMENPVINLPESSDSEDDLYKQSMELHRKTDWLDSTDYQNHSYYQQERATEEFWHDTYSTEETLQEHLQSQILTNSFKKSDLNILNYMILLLDDDGYFRTDISSIAKHFSVSDLHVLHLLEHIWELEPAGVGARDLKECLKLQLQRLSDVPGITQTIIDEHLPELAKNHFSQLARKLHVPLNHIEDAHNIIKTLNPKPGSHFAKRVPTSYIQPDAVILKEGNSFQIIISDKSYFTIDAFYRQMLKETSDVGTRIYLSNKIQQAEWMQKCISQRKETLFNILQIIIDVQYDFFMYGNGHQNPLKLSQIAEKLNVHESTISRAMKGKYLQCSWGMYPLNYFLTSAATKNLSGTDTKTAEQIKVEIKKIIDSEDKKSPLSDQHISTLLAEMGLNISRRTVNKYRTEMGIPDKGGRKII